MRTFSKVTMACLVMTVVFAMTGCNKHRDEEYVVVQAGPPPPPYVILEDKAKGVSYAVLQEGSVTTKEIDGWKALSPEFFTKLSNITVTAPAPDTMAHPGFSYHVPAIEASKLYPERKMATISTGSLVPKELNGWVAISHETLEKLAKDFMTTK